jgi:hypothetical protein
MSNNKVKIVSIWIDAESNKKKLFFSKEKLLNEHVTQSYDTNLISTYVIYWLTRDRIEFSIACSLDDLIKWWFDFHN